MGGARQAGRWFDSNVLQRRETGVLFPAVLPYQAATGTGLFRGPGEASLPAPPGPPPDLTDQAIRMARERERRRQSGGGRRSSFLTGALGESGAASTTVQRLMGS